jgi:hypothetical protein
MKQTNKQTDRQTVWAKLNFCNIKLAGTYGHHRVLKVQHRKKKATSISTEKNDWLHPQVI